MLRLFRRRGEPPVPQAVAGELIPPHTGYKCPFYGFVGTGGVFMDNHGNACALTGAHSPCAMEMQQQTPAWDSCKSWNHDGNAPTIAAFMDSVRVFPETLRPAGASSWGGISLRVWFERVMGRPYS